MPCDCSNNERRDIGDARQVRADAKPNWVLLKEDAKTTPEVRKEPQKEPQRLIKFL